MNAPTYKLPKHLVKLLNTHITLKNYYNVTNSTNLATELTHLVINENYRLITYDIKDLFVGIPTGEVIGITKSVLAKNNNTKTTKQIIDLMRLVLSQNYFMFQNRIYQAKKGVTMGFPISSIIAEIFIQHPEDAHIKYLLFNSNIIFYTWYVDDIQIIYDTKKLTQTSSPHT